MLKSTLAQNMLMGSNQYPRSFEEDLNTLNIDSQTTSYQKKGKPAKREDGQGGVAFAQADKSTVDRKDFKDVIYYDCREKWHYTRTCEKNKEQIHTTMADSSDYESKGVQHIFNQNIMGILSNI